MSLSRTNYITKHCCCATDVAREQGARGEIPCSRYHERQRAVAAAAAADIVVARAWRRQWRLWERQPVQARLQWRLQGR